MLYCCHLVRVQPLSLAWADYPIFYLGISKFSPQQPFIIPILLEEVSSVSVTCGRKIRYFFILYNLARVGSVTYCLTRQHNQNSLRFFLQVESFLTKQHRSNIVWEWLSYWLGDSILGCLSSSLEDGKI